MQLIGGLLVLGGAALAVLKGERGKDSSSQPSAAVLQQRLDDAVLRSELINVVTLSRSTLEQKIEKHTDHVEIMLHGLDGRLRSIELDVGVLKARA